MKSLMDYFVIPIIILWLTVSISVFADNSQNFNFIEEIEMTTHACSVIDSIKPELRTSYLQLTKRIKNSCQISAYNAFKQINQSQALLIDTRNKTHYHKVSIPGSLNIPLHALKTKAFLKNKNIILINDGSNSIGLNQVCHELRHSGIQVQVVTGGLTSWLKLSHTNSNDTLALAELDQMSPELFYYELLLSDNLLVSLTESSSGLDPLFKYKTHTIYSQQNIHSVVTQLKSLLRKKPMTQRLFLYDQNGSLSPKLKELLKEQLREPVFYLKGGAVAYHKFRQKQLAMLKRLKYPPQTLYRCRG